MSEATGWPVRFADDVGVSAPPSEQELAALRELQAA
jgi:glutaconate CoA-transferase subunit B